MQREPTTVDRKMVPRWRSLSLTPHAELVSSKKQAFLGVRLANMDEVLAEWRRDRTPWAASEILSNAMLAGPSPQADEAAAFLTPLIPNLAPGVRGLLHSYRIRTDGEAKFGEVLPNKYLRRRAISEIKALVALYPRNAVAQVDLARLYVSLGQSAPAEAAFRRALALAPQSRFVVRCAVRFYVHQGDVGAAWHALKGAQTEDPWLLACKIAVADMAKKPLNEIRSARRMIEDGRSDQITELAASVATLEMSSGAIRNARKLFRRSAVTPTDNSVAQIRWASDGIGVPFDEKLLDTALSYEARCAQAMKDSDWPGALVSSRQWLQDEPFSIRAAERGCYVACELLQDFRSAEELATIGLIATPNNVTLLNNRAYARANLKDIDGAWSDINQAKTKEIDLSNRICLDATEGCILYRSGHPSEGSEKYREAVQRSLDSKKLDYAQRAMSHWIYEDAIVGLSIDPETATLILNFFENSKSVEKEVLDVFAIYARPYLLDSRGISGISKASTIASSLLNSENA